MVSIVALLLSRPIRMALLVTMCMQKDRKETAEHHGSEAQGAAAMLRDKSKAVAADAPPNGASHADGKLLCCVTRARTTRSCW